MKKFRVEERYIHIGGLDGLMCVEISDGERNVVLVSTCMRLETIDYMPKMVDHVLKCHVVLCK